MYFFGLILLNIIPLYSSLSYVSCVSVVLVLFLELFSSKILFPVCKIIRRYHREGFTCRSFGGSLSWSPWESNPFCSLKYFPTILIIFKNAKNKILIPVAHLSSILRLMAPRTVSQGEWPDRVLLHWTREKRVLELSSIRQWPPAQPHTSEWSRSL